MKIKDRRRKRAGKNPNRKQVCPTCKGKKVLKRHKDCKGINKD